MKQAILKIFMGSLLLTGKVATAKEGVDFKTGSGSLSVMNLECRIKIGFESPVEERTFTELSEHYLNINESAEDMTLELRHEMLSVLGCNVTSLDKIKIHALRKGFGFIQAAPISVLKVREPSFINGVGKCVQRFTEKLSVLIGEDIVLNSESSEFREASDCDPS
jgi:hypothetical protein